MSGAAERGAAPVLRVVKGDVSPEEIAALVAVFASLGPTSTEPPAPRPEWSSPHRLVRTPHLPGPGCWRASGLPRAKA